MYLDVEIQILLKLGPLCPIFLLFMNFNFLFQSMIFYSRVNYAGVEDYFSFQ